MIKAEAFLALEASLGDRLAAGLKKHMATLWAEIEALLDTGDYSEAERKAQSFSLQALADENEKFIEYVTNLAMLFGASRVTRKPGTSVVGLGFERNTAFNAVMSFKQALVHNGEALLKKQALQLIASHKAKASVTKAERVVQPFGSFMDSAGRAMFNIASSLHTSRLSAYGFTAEADVLGYEEYQINEQLDARTCGVCAEMHGKVFKVADARRLLDVVVRTTDPNDLTQLQPWPKQNKETIESLKTMTSAELVARGWHIPPFHPRCRGLLSKVGKIPTNEQIVSGNTQEQPYLASAEDFKYLGVKASPFLVSQWNKMMGVSPAEVVATMTGLTVDQVLNKALTSLVPKEVLGLVSITAGKNHVGVETLGLLPKTKGNVLQDYYFKKDGTLYIGAVEVSSADGGSALTPVLKNMLALAESTGMDKITTAAGYEAGGYALAKLGFKPSVNAWYSLRKELVKKASVINIPAAQSPAIDAILKSDDPTSIFTLADIPTGKKLLMGTAWQATLNLADEEAMIRFKTFLGA